MFTCKRCEAVVSDGAKCSMCEGQYDFPCAGISESGWRKLGDRRNTWKCSNCKGLSPSTSAIKTTTSDFQNIMSELRRLSGQMEVLPTLMENMKTVQKQLADIKAIKTELSEIKCSVDFVHDSVKELAAKISSIEQEIESLKKTKVAITTLQERCSRLEAQQQDNEQRSRLNNIEIKGVPLQSSENLFSILDKIGNKIQCQIPKEQISYIARVPMRSDSRNKMIICSVVNSYLKHDFIAAAKKYKNLTISDLGLQGDSKIFINDHLTMANKLLLNKTKSLARDRGFEFVWVQGCKIFLRKNQTSPKHQIKTEEDLKKFF